MPTKQEIVQSKVTVDEFGNVTVREVTRFTDTVTGEIVAQSNPHTHTVQPGDDLSKVSGIAKEIATKVHTSDRKAAAVARRNL
jgi:hypothetical protein